MAEPVDQGIGEPSRSARSWSAWPFYPFIVGLWSVVLLYGQNTGEASPVDALLPIVWSLSLAALVFGAAYVLFRDVRRAGLLTGLLMVLFLSYGRVLEAVDSPLVTSGRLLILWGVLGVLAVIGVWRLHRDLRVATVRLNAVAALLFVIALVPAVLGEVGDSAGVAAVPEPSIAPGEGTAGPERDIYVIIVEDIGSERILRDVWGMTGDSPFAFLEELGFSRVTDSHSNYGKTAHSLASMFNLDYLDETAAAMGPESGDYEPVYELLDNPASARFLKERGYEYVHIGSWWDPTARSSIADVNMGLETPSDFATAWLETTDGAGDHEPPFQVRCPGRCGRARGPPAPVRVGDRRPGRARLDARPARSDVRIRPLPHSPRPVRVQPRRLVRDRRAAGRALP